MIYIILQSILGAACLSVALCGLLTNRMKYKNYVIIFLFPFFLAILAFYYNIGQTMTIAVIILDLFIIFMAQRTHPIANFCLACMGYMINVAFNYIIVTIITGCFDINYTE